MAPSESDQRVSELVGLTSPTSAAATAAACDLVTLIITTSPTPSAPSTDLISAIILSFRLHCPALTDCRVILVLDTFDRVAAHSRLKKGQVTPDGAANFAEYKENAKRLVLEQYGKKTTSEGEEEGMELSYAEAEYGADAYAQQTNAVTLAVSRTRDGRVTFIEPLQRIGFGLAVRSALRLTETPYVWVQQHDWALVADIPLDPLLALMRQQQGKGPAAETDNGKPGVDAESRQVVTVPIKYVCFPSVRMTRYATSDHVMLFPALRALTNLHKQNFSPPASTTRLAASDGDAAEKPAVKIPLTPLFFWHDKPHLAETEHYLAQVFPNRLAMSRGGFIEDTVGQRARAEMKNGQWKKWACWLYYPDEGKQLCVRHLKGRTWLGVEAETARKLEWASRGVETGRVTA